MINTNIHKVLYVRARYIIPEIGEPTVSLELMTDGGDAAIHLSPSEAMRFARVVQRALEEALHTQRATRLRNISPNEEVRVIEL